MEEILKEALRRLSRLAGRKFLYKASHFFIRAARGDVKNNYEFNGEKMVQTVALRTAASPATVFDVGANVGDWTAGLLEVSKNLKIPAHVYAFEPCAGTFSRLSARHGNSPAVTLVNEACGPSAGTAVMHVYGSGAGTNSLAEPAYDREAGGEQVRVTTIDLFCKANRIEAVDLLKIDAEGYDFEVIAGAAETFDRHAVRIVQFEYNFCWIGARHFLKDVFSFLMPKGYAVGKLTGSAVEFYPQWEWELETWDGVNYVACPKENVRQFRCWEPSWLSVNGSPRLGRQPNRP